MDLKLDLITWDLAIENGDLVLISGAEEVRQRVAITLRARRGEWIFNNEFGVPWDSEVMVKNPDLDAIRARLLAIIYQVSGVSQVLELTLDHDPETRKLTGFVRIQTIYGTASLEF